MNCNFLTPIAIKIGKILILKNVKIIIWINKVKFRFMPSLIILKDYNYMIFYEMQNSILIFSKQNFSVTNYIFMRNSFV